MKTTSHTAKRLIQVFTNPNNYILTETFNPCDVNVSTGNIYITWEAFA